MEKEQEKIKELLCELGYEDSVLFENPSYSSAVSGISNDGRVIYDYELMVEYLMMNDEMTYEDAVEFIEYNTIRALPYFGDKSPIVMTGFDYLR